jgi:cell division septation protein DedD
MAMRDFELDDSFWRDALAVLEAGEPVDALADRYPDYAGLLGELALDAAAEPVLIGLRHAAADENPRLLAYLSAAFLAGAGRRTLLLDLDPEVRWLEQLLGEDFKEGVVDHLQFGIPLERCARPSVVGGLEVMSGGAAFLAGSPLDDPPRFRAALLALKEGRDAVLVVLPPPAESADGAGIPALCDAVVTIEDAEGRPESTLGTERGIVRLSGDPRAARELARLCHRFVGPLPALLARGGNGGTASSRNPSTPAARPARPGSSDLFFAPEPDASPAVAGPDTESDELDFLSAFEGHPSAEPSPAEAAEESANARLREIARNARKRRAGGREAGGARPMDRRALTLATVVLASVAALALGSRWLLPMIRGGGPDGPQIARGEIERSPTATGEPGTVIPLTGPRASPEAGEVEAAVDGEGDTPGGVPADAPGQPTPFSVHVGSYRTASAADGVVRDLRQRGLNAFASPVVLPGMGEWVRVYVGAYGDRAEGKATLDRLTGSGVVAEGAVRNTPLAFGFGVYPTEEEADEKASGLVARGIPAYVIGDGPYRVWAGAFESEDESRVLASALEGEAGGPFQLSRRER